MDRKLMSALKATSYSAVSSLQNLQYWYLDFIDWYSDDLDSNKHYEVLKAYKKAKNEIMLYVDDLNSVCAYAYAQVKEDVVNRIQKQSIRQKDQWDINMINRIVMELETASIMIQDMLEFADEINPSELTKQIESLKEAPAKLREFKDSPFTALCKVLDEENALALTDRVVNEKPQSQAQNQNQDLLIRLGKEVSLSSDEQRVFKSILNKFAEPKVFDFNSKLKVQYEHAQKQNAGHELVPFKSEFMIKSLNRELGEATGIVMPAGSLERRYLDGDYFPEDVVRMSMIGWVIDSPQINRDHEESDLFNFWEHPHFRIVETWQERTGFMLGGEKVMPGDWVATIRAVTDEARDGLMNGLFNGFSVEGFVTYYPDELLSSTQNS